MTTAIAGPGGLPLCVRSPFDPLAAARSLAELAPVVLGWCPAWIARGRALEVALDPLYLPTDSGREARLGNVRAAQWLAAGVAVAAEGLAELPVRMLTRTVESVKAVQEQNAGGPPDDVLLSRWLVWSLFKASVAADERAVLALLADARGHLPTPAAHATYIRELRRASRDLVAYWELTSAPALADRLKAELSARGLTAAAVPDDWPRQAGRIQSQAVTLWLDHALGQAWGRGHSWREKAVDDCSQVHAVALTASDGAAVHTVNGLGRQDGPDPDSSRFWFNGRPAKLTPKPFRVLAFLWKRLTKEGDAVSARDLARHVNANSGDGDAPEPGTLKSWLSAANSTLQQLGCDDRWFQWDGINRRVVRVRAVVQAVG